jgi:SMODS-associated and fused to various effectors sensor domain
MLLCDAHHRLIDRDGLTDHPESLLLEMKREHEARVANVLGVNPVQASHVLRFAARIGEHESPVAEAMVFRDMLPDLHPAGWRTLDIEIVGSELTDDKPEYWTYQRDNLRRAFEKHVRGRIERHDIEHLSVFALAPMPLLVELGRLLGDKVPVAIRQLHRNPKTWRWQNDKPPMTFRTAEPPANGGTIALKLSISATIADDRIRAVLGNASIWSIEADGPHNDILRSPTDLDAFGQLTHRMLNRIKAVHGEQAEIHVFPAIPVSAAVELGRRWMPKADLPLVIWDQNRTAGGFIRALDIRSEEGH